MKMLTTQVGGLFQRIAASGEDSIEETARLLAQAAIGEGRVIIASFGEMNVVSIAAQYGVEPFKGIVIPYQEGMEITTADRVWILTRTETDNRALQLAKQIANQFIPFAAVASGKSDGNNELADLAYTYISTQVTRGLLPGDDGQRIVQPHALASLFILEAVKLSFNEMLEDD